MVNIQINAKTISVKGLYTYQIEALKALAFRKNVITESVRQTGKSMIGSVWLIEKALSNKGNNSQIISANQGKGKHILETIQYLLEKFERDNNISIINEIDKNYIKLLNNSTISLQSIANYSEGFSSKLINNIFIDELDYFDKSYGIKILETIQSKDTRLCQLFVASSLDNSKIGPFSQLWDFVVDKDFWVKQSISDSDLFLK